jgi:SAM-dependent methyltransferase
MVMRPDDLVEIGRRYFADGEQVKFWGSDAIVTKGLSPLEKIILEKINLTQGKVLVLGMGGGREAIPLAQMGFAVTGVDYIPEIVEMAKENAAKHGVRLDALVGDFSTMALPPAYFDLVVLSDRMYSSIPTRKSRVAMLKRTYETLKPGGCFFCMFNWNPIPNFSPKVDLMRKIAAYLTLGNLWYEPGDGLLMGCVYVHAFRDEGEVASEFAEGGFELIHLHIPREKGDTHGVAILRKAK